jgi:hypothetical protein
VLYALSTRHVARPAATHFHTSASLWSPLISHPTNCDVLQSEWCVAGSAGRRNIHISPYMGMSLILKKRADHWGSPLLRVLFESLVVSLRWPLCMPGEERCPRSKRHLIRKLPPTAHTSFRPTSSDSIKGRFTLYVTFPFRRGMSPFSKIFSCVIKRRYSHWQERLRHVSVPFRRRCWARIFDVTERVRTGLNLLDSDMNSLTSPPLHLECCLFLSSEMDEKLIKLVRKCEELYDMSNKNYSESVWIEKLWGQLGESWKSFKSQSFLLHILKLL